MIIGNPEFHRNVWLRFSPWRLIAMPVLVFLTLGLFVQTSGDWRTVTSPVSMTLFYVVVFLWGNYEAAKAPVEEIREKTWDFQKMSSLGPWELTFGKLIGATSYVWYFGITLLLVFMFSQYGDASTGKVLDYSRLGTPLFNEKAPLSEILFSGAWMVLSGLIGHATAFFIGLYHMRINKFGVIGSFIVGLITSHTVLSLSEMIDFSAHFGRIADTIGWMGMHVPNNTFLILSMLFWIGWLVIGNQRLMREEIGFRNKPVAWGLFVLTFALYLAGVFGGAPFNPMGGYIVAFFFALFCSYGVMVNEASDLTMYRKFWYGWRNNQPRMWQENLPKWAVAAAITLVLIPLTALQTENPDHRGDAMIFFIGLCLFAIRDGFILHSILLPPGGRYGRFSMLVYWALVYFLLPGMFFGENIGDFLSDALSDADKGSKLRMSMSFFFPVATSHSPLYLLPVLGEIAVAVIILKNRLMGIGKVKPENLPHSEKRV